ncbi:hypothetical protein HpKG25_11390 [Helicobacter pylori]
MAVSFNNFPNNPNNSPQLRQFLNNKCHFIGFVEIFIEPSESLFFVYENEPSTTFNLKNFLLVLTYSEKTKYTYIYSISFFARVFFAWKNY